jgi:hypothetical protein
VLHHVGVAAATQRDARPASVRERDKAAKEREMARLERERAAVGDCNRPIHEAAARLHESAALLHDRMADMYEHAEALGHKNASETLDTYSHLWPADEDRVRDAIEGLHGPSRVTRVSHATDRTL